jgi:prepilin-type N-terminal cleavage/methylation domain-containing protein
MVTGAAMATQAARSGTAVRRPGGQTARQTARGGACTFRAFTLIELLVVLAILALLLTIATPRYIHYVERAREAALHSSLKVMREAIDKFSGDQGRLPSGLDELVARNYLKAIPVDPITGQRDTWVPLTEADLPPPAPPLNGSASPPFSGSAAAAPAARPDPGIADVRSGAPGNGEDGTPYQEW